MKELFKTYEEAKETANAIDTAWGNDPENEALENAFDEAYKAEYNAFTALVAGIVEITNGAIDKKTAVTMIKSRYNDLKTIINTFA